jgi:hypothetical protein
VREGLIPPSQVGKTLVPSCPHVLVTVTRTCVPVGKPRTFAGDVLIEYEVLPTPADDIALCTAEVTVVPVAVVSAAARAP